MGQPFIIAGGPHSLKYIRSYGFRTFHDIWDESYDSVTSSNKRINCISTLIKHIATLSDAEYNTLFSKAKAIALFNRTHFYSTSFEDILHQELHNNRTDALNMQSELFYSKPGGTWFEVLQELKNNGKEPIKQELTTSRNLIKYMEPRYPDLTEEIIKKYPSIL